MQPLPTTYGAPQAAQHWAGQLQGGLLSHQTLAITALTAFVGDGSISAGANRPMAPMLRAAIARLLRAQGPAMGQAIMAQLAHNHPHHDASEEGSSRTDMCVKTSTSKTLPCFPQDVHVATRLTAAQQAGISCRWSQQCGVEGSCTMPAWQCSSLAKRIICRQFGVPLSHVASSIPVEHITMFRT